MIKIKEFTELTEKDKASIRELIDDCIRYEQLELAVPDLNEEDGTAYLYYQCFHKSVPEAYGRIRGNSSMLLSRWKQL